METDLRPGYIHRRQPHHIGTADNKTYVLVVDSTCITNTDKGVWKEAGWKVKPSFIKLHILVEEEFQKMLAFA